MQIFLSVIFLLLYLSLSSCTSSVRQKESQVCFKNKCFRVEVVHKLEDIQRGLQFRKFLGQDQGMLFVFPQSRQQSFWMKDTLIPLDMIWLDYKRRIIYIERDVPPCQSDPCPTYRPSTEAMYVLEVNAGLAEAQRIQEGDVAWFDLTF